MASPRRVEKVNILLREEISRILEQEFPPPEGTMVTVTRVATSDDFYYASVFISVLAQNRAAEDTVFAELAPKTGAVQRRLNRALRMRPVPRITFKADEDERKRERIEEILAGNNGKIDSAPIL